MGKNLRGRGLSIAEHLRKGPLCSSLYGGYLREEEVPRVIRTKHKLKAQ